MSTITSKIENTPAILDDEKANILRAGIGHRATWMALTYDEAVKAGKAEEGEAFARKGISRTGCMHGAAYRAKCKDPTDCAEFGDVFLTPLVRSTFEVEVKEQTPERLAVEFHHCPLLKAWQDLGFDDDTCALLCDIAMDGDRGIATGMQLNFHLGDTIANGKKTCQVTFYR